MRRYHTLFVRLAAATFLATSLAGCVGGEEFHRGYFVDEQTVSQVKKGMSGEQVLTTLGTPSTVSTVGNKSWYYISQTSRRTFQFMGEQIVEQKVMAVAGGQPLMRERGPADHDGAELAHLRMHADLPHRTLPALRSRRPA